MLFVVLARFRPGAANETARMRSDFNQHLASNHPRLRLGGPLHDGQGQATGVFYIAEAPDAETMTAFIHASPFYKAELYERIDVDVLNLEIGGLQ